MALEELALVTGQSDVADATAYQVGAPGHLCKPVALIQIPAAESPLLVEVLGVTAQSSGAAGDPQSAGQ